MKYLFVCLMGMDRSPTAARVAKSMAIERKVEIDAHSCGIAPYIAEAQNPSITSERREEIRRYFDQYDTLFVMQEFMAENLIGLFNVNKDKIKCLDIPNFYQWEDSHLVDILEDRLDKWIV